MLTFCSHFETTFTHFLICESISMKIILKKIWTFQNGFFTRKDNNPIFQLCRKIKGEIEKCLIVRISMIGDTYFNLGIFFQHYKTQPCHMMRYFLPLCSSLTNQRFFIEE